MQRLVPLFLLLLLAFLVSSFVFQIVFLWYTGIYRIRDGIAHGQWKKAIEETFSMHTYILSQTHDFQFVRREIGWGRPHYQSMFQLVLLKILNSDTVDLSHSQRSHASPIIIEINFQHCTHIFGKFIIIRWDYSLSSAFFFLLIAFWVVELDRV